jgi:hypothetical protein
MYVQRNIGGRSRTIFAVESNKYYIFLYLCVCAREEMQTRVDLLIHYAKRRRHIVCVLSGSTIFFDIIL